MKELIDKLIENVIMRERYLAAYERVGFNEQATTNSICLFKIIANCNIKIKEIKKELLELEN